MQALHGAALRVGKAAHIARDLPCDDRLGRDHRVESREIHNVEIAHARHLGHDLLHAVALGCERHEEILLVAVGHGDERIAVEDPLGFEQAVVCAVAVNDGRLRQLFCKGEALVFVLFHDGHMRAKVCQQPGKILRDAPAAENAHAPDRRHRAPH